MIRHDDHGYGPVVDPRVWDRIARVEWATPDSGSCDPAEAITAPALRIMGAHAGETYYVFQWFARLSEASTWARLFWVSQS